MISFTYEILLYKKVRLTRGYIAPICGEYTDSICEGYSAPIYYGGGTTHRMLLSVSSPVYAPPPHATSIAAPEQQTSSSTVSASPQTSG